LADPAHAVSRRGFLGGVATVVGVLGVGGARPTTAQAATPAAAVTRSALSGLTAYVNASDLDPSGYVEIVQGVIDYSGARTATTQIVAMIPAATLNAAPTSVTVDTSSSSYVRANYVVPDAHGTQVKRGFTNPTMLLCESPPSSSQIPTPRVSPDNN
jgi:hypothetical protein